MERGEWSGSRRDGGLPPPHKLFFLNLHFEHFKVSTCTYTYIHVYSVTLIVNIIDYLYSQHTFLNILVLISSVAAKLALRPHA